MDVNCSGTFRKRTLCGREKVIRNLSWPLTRMVAENGPTMRYTYSNCRKTAILCDIHEIYFFFSVRLQKHKRSKSLNRTPSKCPWPLTKMNKYRDCMGVQMEFCDGSRT